MIKINKTLSCAIPVALAGCLISGQALAIAETVHPRDYIPAPAGLNLSVTYIQNRSGDDLYSNGEKIADNFGVEANAVINRVIHYTEIFGMPADPQIIVPIVDLKVDATGDESTGIGDTIIGSTFWPIADNENKRWLGISPFIYIPTGDYDENNTFNIGANRFSFVLQAGYTQALTDKLYLDLVGEVEWYGDNDELGAGNTLSKDETYRFSSMLSYDVTPGSYVWSRYSKQKGGEESIDGVANGLTDLDTDTLTVGYTHWVGQDYQLQLEYTRDLAVENGVEQDGLTFRLAVPF